MNSKPEYPPKAVELNLTEKLPEMEKRPSRLISHGELPDIIQARIALEQILSAHHKSSEGQEAIENLGEAGRQALHKILQEPNNFDYVIRRDAITALTYYRDPESILLLASLVNDPQEDEVNIGRALDAIAVIGGHGANRILMQAYRNSRRKYVKSRALKAILQSDDPYFIPIFKETVEQHKSPQLRRIAIEKLAFFEVSVAEPDIPELKGDPTTRVARSK